MRTSSGFGEKKNFGYFKIYDVTRGGELSRTGHFADKEKGVNFLRFCANIFNERPKKNIGVYIFLRNCPGRPLFQDLVSHQYSSNKLGYT